MIASTPELAAKVLKEIEEQDLTYEAIQAAGGPSDTTIGKIVKGDGYEFAAATGKKLDTALDWYEGRTADITRGKDDPAKLSAHRVRAGREALGMTPRQLAELIQASKEAVQEWERGGEIPPEPLARMREIFTKTTDATELLEEVLSRERFDRKAR